MDKPVPLIPPESYLPTTEIAVWEDLLWKGIEADDAAEKTRRARTVQDK